MPQRNSKKQDQNATVLRRSPRFLGNNTMIQAEPTTTPRRSLRILAKNRDFSEDPKTPVNGKIGAMGGFLGVSSCVRASKTRNLGFGNVLKESNFGKEGCVKEGEGLNGSEQLESGVDGLSCLRRSSRLSGKENVNSRSRLNFDELSKGDKDLGVRKVKVGVNILGKENVNSGSGLKKGDKDLGKKNEGVKKVYVAAKIMDLSSRNVVIGLDAEFVGETKKKGNSNQGNARKIARKFTMKRNVRAVEDLNEVLDRGASLSVERISKSGLGVSDKKTVGESSKAPVKSREEKEARAAEKKPMCIGVKRKRNQVEEGGENQGTIAGWTKEQDAQLQKAYFAAKPTPRFWKDVAKMVPGKSADDCFNRIHADYQTPRQTQRRSRARIVNSSPVPYSASKLLDSIRPKSKRPGHTKRKSHLVHKTTRQLLQKQCQVDRDRNADLFSILEPQASPFSNALQQGVNCSTPKQGESQLLRRCQEPSSSTRSRFNSMNEASLESPPVLKPVRNKVLHEKYIDVLHAREAKRRAVAARAAKSSLNVPDRKECCVQKNAVESAKNALLLDARAAINQFQHEQANDFSSFPDDGDDDDDLNSDEDI